ITDFSVVVLPAPLRPSSVTTSPAWTSKTTPCRTWDSPYQACRSRTASSGVRSRMAGAHVGLDHLRIARHARIIALGQHLAARQDGDGVRQVLDDAQIVLDHEDRAIRGHALDQRGDAVD